MDPLDADGSGGVAMSDDDNLRHRHDTGFDATTALQDVLLLQPDGGGREQECYGRAARTRRQNRAQPSTRRARDRIHVG